jgi:hypothetical protein
MARARCVGKRPLVEEVVLEYSGDQLSKGAARDTGRSSQGYRGQKTYPERGMQ